MLKLGKTKINFVDCQFHKSRVVVWLQVLKEKEKKNMK